MVEHSPKVLASEEKATTTTTTTTTMLRGFEHSPSKGLTEEQLLAAMLNRVTEHTNYIY